MGPFIKLRAHDSCVCCAAKSAKSNGNSDELVRFSSIHERATACFAAPQVLSLYCRTHAGAPVPAGANRHDVVRPHELDVCRSTRSPSCFVGCFK